MIVSALVVHAQRLGVLSTPKEATLVPVERSQTQIVWSSEAVTPLAPSGDMHSGTSGANLPTMDAPRSTGGFRNRAPGSGKAPPPIDLDGIIGSCAAAPVLRS